MYFFPFVQVQIQIEFWMFRWNRRGFLNMNRSTYIVPYFISLLFLTLQIFMHANLVIFNINIHSMTQLNKLIRCAIHFFSALEPQTWCYDFLPIHTLIDFPSHHLHSNKMDAALLLLHSQRINMKIKYKLTSHRSSSFMHNFENGIKFTLARVKLLWTFKLNEGCKLYTSSLRFHFIKIIDLISEMADSFNSQYTTI